jgi:electron transfer flavoprotein beta subunit
MSKILACYKWTLDEQDIKINTDDLSLDTSRAKYQISEYDKNAIEEAVALFENNDANVDVLTFGTAAVKKSLKDVLSRGPEKAFYVADDLALSADAFVTANVLAAAIRKNGPYDLVICAEGSSDDYHQQVGPRLGEVLGLPVISYVQKLELDGNKIVATRKLSDCTEVATVEGPAVICVLPEINKPRIPSLKQVLAAAKKPSEEIALGDLELSDEDKVAKCSRVSLKGFVMSRKNVIYNDSDAAANVAKLVSSLETEGLA